MGNAEEWLDAGADKVGETRLPEQEREGAGYGPEEWQ
jgi:hypothetical protein